MRKCDICGKKYKKTPYRSCVIITLTDLVLCMKCYFCRKDLQQFTYNNHLIYFLKNREIGM